MGLLGRCAGELNHDGAGGVESDIRRLVKRGLMQALKLSVNSTKRKLTFVTLRIHSSEVDRFIRRNMA